MAAEKEKRPRAPRRAGSRELRRRWIAPSLAALLAVPTLVAPPVRADVIVLQNGNEIQGEVLGETAGKIIVRFPGGTLELKKKDVARIRRQDRRTYLLELAEKEMLRGGHQDAIATLSRAVREYPGCALARERLLRANYEYAGALGELHRYEDAKDLYREILRGHPGEERAREEIRLLEAEEEEIRAEEERALAEIHRGDLETGIWRLRRIHDTFSDRREAVSVPLARALIQEARELRAKALPGDAAERLEEAMAVAPASVEAARGLYAECKIAAIAALLEKQAFEDVERIASAALEVAPGSPELRYALALALEARGSTGRAARLYASILEKDPPAQPERAVEGLRREAAAVLERRGGTSEPGGPGGTPAARAYHMVSTPHFVVLHRDPREARRLGAIAEEAYHQLFRTVGATTHWWPPCRIQVFSSRQEYLEHAGAGEWSGAAHRLDTRTWTSEHSIATYEGQPRLADGLLKHEIAHALLVHRLNYPRAVPLWANEGFAVLAEPRYLHDHYRRIVEQERERGTLIPLADLLVREAYPDTNVERFYAHSFSLVEYLAARKGGVGRFIDFLMDLRTPGADLEKALQDHYEIAGVLALENRWRAFLSTRDRSRSARR